MGREHLVREIELADRHLVLVILVQVVAQVPLLAQATQPVLAHDRPAFTGDGLHVEANGAQRTLLDRHLTLHVEEELLLIRHRDGPLLAVVGSMAALPALRPWALKRGGAGRLLPTSTHVERGGGAASTLRANAILRPRWLLTTFGLRPRPRLSMRLLRLLLRCRPSLTLPTKTWMLSMR